MNPQVLKGVVLAAGFGTRLRPLTDIWPKPIVPFLGSTPLRLALGRLVAADIRQIAINTHYDSKKIEMHLRDCPYGVTPLISFEKQILGTGGVYNPLRKWQGLAHLVVLNGDIVSNIDINRAIACHFDTNAVATMVLLAKVLPGESAVYYKDSQVLEIGKIGPLDALCGNFACAQILSPKFLDLLPSEGSFDIISKGYHKALAHGLRVSAIVHRGAWHDIGTVGRYAHGVFDIISQPDLLKSIGCDLDAVTVTAEGGVIESGAIIAAGAVVERSIVLPGGTLAATDHVSKMIITSTARISFEDPA